MSRPDEVAYDDKAALPPPKKATDRRHEPGIPWAIKLAATGTREGRFSAVFTLT